MRRFHLGCGVSGGRTKESHLEVQIAPDLHELGEGDAGELVVVIEVEHFGDVERLPAGSALKFCYLAEGRGDIYPRFSPCCEWDTAAGQAVLEAAGGSLVDLEFNPLRYNQQSSIMSPNFYGLARTGTNWKEILG